jgi:regulatory protein
MAGNKKRTEPEPAYPLSGVITSLAAKGANAERVSVYLDGRRMFDLSASVAVGADLHKDEFLTEERVAALLEQDEPQRAREAALRLLARKELPKRELGKRLTSSGVSEKVVASTVAWLEELGYLDDQRYAAAYAAEKLKAGWGRQRVVSELVRRGVERELLTVDAWGELLEQRGIVEDLQQVIDLVKRRFGGQIEADPAAAKRRISGFLARRGHDWQTIGSVLRAVSKNEDPSERVTWPDS